MRPVALVVMLALPWIGCGDPEPGPSAVDPGRDAVRDHGVHNRGTGPVVGPEVGGFQQAGQAGSGGPEGRAVATYTTGEEYVLWPDYHFPLVHQLDVPEVPESLQSPAPAGGGP